MNSPSVRVGIWCLVACSIACSDDRRTRGGSGGAAPRDGGADAASGDGSGTLDGGHGDGSSLEVGGFDAAVGPDAAGPELGPLCPPALDPPGPNRCDVTLDLVDCPFERTELEGRPVYYQVPLGVPPAAGFPAVVVFQGSFFSPEETQAGGPDLPFGGFYQVQLQALLLHQGFVVIAPSARAGLAWATNFPGYESSEDHAVMLALLDELHLRGRFGPVDPARVYATGISSGGYMTSRMAVSYPGRFRALAINAGSYATCTNVLCSIPDPLPADHPPTLFLHGARDLTVPLYTAEAYRDQLWSQGLEADLLVDAQAGHEWLSAAPSAIGCWFLSD
ncbi:MAG: prolyl oligopeptidase family serine peptidase [Deltaproteobacteria bacterium]|nr:prolyl oligopeptidase family serine peptidase [Deltaproteobacteria bacterium]